MSVSAYRQFVSLSILAKEEKMLSDKERTIIRALVEEEIQNSDNLIRQGSENLSNLAEQYRTSLSGIFGKLDRSPVSENQ